MASAPDSIGFIYEETLLRIADVKRSTWQNWIKTGILDAPKDGRFRETDLVEVGVVTLLVALLRNLEDVKTAWRPERDGVLRDLLANQPSILLLEPRLLHLELVRPEAPIGDVMRPRQATVAIPLTESIRELRENFWRFVQRDTQAVDRRRQGGRRKQARRRAQKR